MKKNKYVTSALATVALGTVFSAQHALADEVADPKTVAEESTVDSTTAAPTTVEQAKDAVEKTHAEVVEDTTAYNDAVKETDAAQQAVNAQTDKVYDLDIAINDVDQDIYDTENAINDTTVELTQANDDLTKAQDRVDAVVKANPNLAADYQEATDNYNDAAQDVKDASQNVQNLEDKAADAQKAFNDAKQAKDTATTNLAAANQDLANAKTAADSADKALTDATDKLADLKQSNADKTKELTDAVNDAVASSTTTRTETRDFGKSNTTGYADWSISSWADSVKRNGYDPKLAVEDVIRDGKATETIDVTDRVKTDANGKKYIEYGHADVNNTKLTEYVVYYINKIRELNGITGRVRLDDASVKYAAERALEMRDTDNMTHDTTNANQNNFGAENILTRPVSESTMADGDVYTDDDEIRPLSDQQLAYQLVNQWFDDAYNVSPHVYGHRLNLLFVDGAVGAGAAIDTADGNDADGQFLYGSLDWAIGAKNSESQYNVENRFENGRSVMYVNGKRLKTLADITFNYTIKEEVPLATQEDVDKAKQALTDHLNKAATEEGKAQDVVNTARNNKVKADADLKAAQTKVNGLSTTNAETVYNDAKQNLDEANNDLKAAKETLSDAQKDLTDAKKALDNVSSLSRVLTDATGQLTKAQERINGLNQRIADLKNDVTKLNKTRDELTAKLKDARLQLEEDQKTLEDATAKEIKAKKDLADSTARYTLAKTNYTNLTNVAPEDKPLPEVVDHQEKPVDTTTEKPVPAEEVTAEKPLKPSESAAAQPALIPAELTYGGNAVYGVEATALTAVPTSEMTEKQSSDLVLPNTGDSDTGVAVYVLALAMLLTAGYASKRREG